MSGLLERIRHRNDGLLPYRLTHLGGLYNTMVGVRLRRPRLRRIAAEWAPRPDDVTVVLGHRNRATHRTANAIRAIAAQHYPHGQVRLMVVDYGSRADELERIRVLVREAGGVCLHVPDVARWSRSHCLNIGLRHVATKYVMVSDADILLAPDYLEQCRALLAREPLSIAVCSCTWLPEELDPLLLAAARQHTLPDLKDLRVRGEVRTAHGYSTGMVFVLSPYLFAVGGFDEALEGYGSQDVDLVRRLRFLGLRVTSLDRVTSYLHQWHPRYDGLPDDEVERMLKRNAAHSKRTNTIVRNRGDWGRATTVTLDSPARPRA